MIPLHATLSVIQVYNQRFHSKPCDTLLLILHPLCGGGDLFFLPSPPPHFVSGFTRKPLFELFPNICSMHIGPGEFAW